MEVMTPTRIRYIGPADELTQHQDYRLGNGSYQVEASVDGSSWQPAGQAFSVSGGKMDYGLDVRFNAAAETQAIALRLTKL